MVEFFEWSLEREKNDFGPIENGLNLIVSFDFLVIFYFRCRLECWSILAGLLLSLVVYFTNGPLWCLSHRSCSGIHLCMLPPKEM